MLMILPELRSFMPGHIVSEKLDRLIAHQSRFLPELIGETCCMPAFHINVASCFSCTITSIWLKMPLAEENRQV